MTNKEWEIELAWAAHRDMQSRARVKMRGGRLYSIIPPSTKLRLAEAQNWRCCWCYRSMDIEKGKPTSATIEHIQPIAWGGTDHIDNLAISCAACNSARGSITAPGRLPPDLRVQMRAALLGRGVDWTTVGAFYSIVQGREADG